MSVGFVSKVLNGTSVCASECVGYSAEEIDAISRLYNLRISGQLYEFLSTMGRCDGGAMGDAIVQLYRPTWRVREHFLFQEIFISDLRDGGYEEYLNRPFVFCFISETQYYFVQSALGDGVFHYDSNDEVVDVTSYDLLGFLHDLVLQVNGDSGGRSVGDLLRI